MDSHPMDSVPVALDTKDPDPMDSDPMDWDLMDWDPIGLGPNGVGPNGFGSNGFGPKACVCRFFPNAPRGVRIILIYAKRFFGGLLDGIIGSFFGWSVQTLSPGTSRWENNLDSFQSFLFRST